MKKLTREEILKQFREKLQNAEEGPETIAKIFASFEKDELLRKMSDKELAAKLFEFWAEQPVFSPLAGIMSTIVDRLERAGKGPVEYTPEGRVIEDHSQRECWCPCACGCREPDWALNEAGLCPDCEEGNHEVVPENVKTHDGRNFFDVTVSLLRSMLAQYEKVRVERDTANQET